MTDFASLRETGLAQEAGHLVVDVGLVANAIPHHEVELIHRAVELGQHAQHAHREARIGFDREAQRWQRDRRLKHNVALRSHLCFALRAQRLMLEEIVFVANELLDRTQTETHLFAELVSKLAGSHSAKDWGTMYRDCSQHQLDFIRRDCDRYFRHGERVLAAAFRLLNDRPRLVGAVMDVKSEAEKNIQP